MSIGVAVYVTVTIPEDKMDEFLKVMKVDVEESRKEEGCTRFDLLQDTENKLKFHFYEIYKDADAAALHKTLPHYLAWAEFKKANPSIGETQTVEKSVHVF